MFELKWLEGITILIMIVMSMKRNPVPKGRKCSRQAGSIRTRELHNHYDCNGMGWNTFIYEWLCVLMTVNPAFSNQVSGRLLRVLPPLDSAPQLEDASSPRPSHVINIPYEAETAAGILSLHRELEFSRCR